MPVTAAKRRETKSPFNQPPSRLPGRSLAERIEVVLYDKLLMWVFLPVVIGMWAVFEWIGWAFLIPRQPIVYTLTANPTRPPDPP